MQHIPSTGNYYSWIIRMAIVLGVSLGIGSSVFMFANKDIAPFWDHVYVLYFLLGGDNGNVPDWFSSDVFDFVDNEHRPFLPMVIWGLDFKYFDSYGLLPQILMQLFAILTAVLVTGWSNLRSNPRSMTALAITICACALMLSPLHIMNLVYPKQIHVYSAALFSVLALSVALNIPKKDWPHQIVLALLSSFLGICATFSFGYGLAVWPALLIHGFLSRWPWRGYLTIVIAGAGTLYWYYRQYTILTSVSDPTESILNPLSLVNYASLLLAGPLVGAGINVTLGHIIGYILLAVFAFVSFRVYVQRRIFDDHQLRSLLIGLYCIGVALLTSLVRVTVNTGIDSRYRIIPTLFILVIPGLFHLRPPIQSTGKQLFIVAFLFGTLGISASSFVFNSDLLHWRQFMIREGAIAATFGTKPLELGLFPNHDITNKHVWPYFIKRHGFAPPLNIFSWVGQTFPPPVLNTQPSASNPQCLGYVDSFLNRESDPNFDIPSGWARLGPHGERSAPWVIITDSSGVVVGLATTGVERPDVEKFLNASWIDNELTATNRAGFTGLVRSQPGDELDFFAYREGEFCKFARNVKAPDA